MLDSGQSRKFPVPRLGRIVGLPAALLLLAAASSAQILNGSAASGGNPLKVPAPVIGTVKTQEGNLELRTVKVEIWTVGGTPVDTAYTDSKGSFMSMALSPGEYIVKVKVEGFEEYREEVTIMGRPGVTLYIMLRKARSDFNTTAPGNAISARELSLPQKAQDEFHKGQEALFTRRNPAEAIPSFQRVIEMAPDFYEAYYYVGVSQMKLGQFADAEASYRKSLAVSQDHFAEPCITLASMFADQRRFAEAEPLARQGLQISPDSFRGHYELARALLGEGRVSDAELSAMEAQKRQPKFARLYVLLANIHIKQKKDDAVLDDLNNYLKLDPAGQYSEQVKQLKEKTELALGRTSTLLPIQQ
jgi:Flp pilus assembly protein TadD